MNLLADIPTMNLQIEGQLTVAYLRGKLEQREEDRVAAFGAIRAAVTFVRSRREYADHLEAGGNLVAATSIRADAAAFRRCVRVAIGSDKA